MNAASPVAGGQVLRKLRRREPVQMDNHERDGKAVSNPHQDELSARIWGDVQQDLMHYAGQAQLPSGICGRRHVHLQAISG